MNPNQTQKKFDSSLSLITWAYNEEENILSFLEHATELLERIVEDYEIILIDDGSKDKTFEIADHFRAKKNPKLKIFKNETNKNVNFCHRRAISLATKQYLTWQMVDWCYDISNLRDYLELLKSWDIVQGVRRAPAVMRLEVLKPARALTQIFGLKHLSSRSDTVPKALVSIFNYILVRILFKVPLSDFQNVSIYPTRWIQSVRFESRSPFGNPEGLIKAHWAGLSIKEVPIGFIARTKGEAKGTNVKIVIKSFYDVFRLWFLWVICKKRSFLKYGKIERVEAEAFKKYASAPESGYEFD